MIDGFKIICEEEPKYSIDKDGNKKITPGRKKYCLTINENVISGYYEGIIYLGDNYFAVAEYDTKIIKYNRYRQDAIIDTKTVAQDAKLKWGIIKIVKQNEHDNITWSEQLVIPYMYDSITPNNNHTATVAYKNKFTFIELDESSKCYGEQIYPCIFNSVSNFDIEYDNFVEVKKGKKTGYIPRNISYETDSEYMLDKQEINDLSEYLEGNKSNLEYDTRYKYMKLTNETPALARILKN